jgi:hypothetical protein
MFPKYKPIEAYEIRPGVLAMPRYAQDGQLCEVGVEKRRYSPELIRIDDDFSQKEIDQIVDELVPVSERGQRLKGLLGGMMTMMGNSYSNAAVYENVTVLSYGGISGEGKRKNDLKNTGDVAFTIQWTKRKC